MDRHLPETYPLPVVTYDDAYRIQQDLVRATCEELPDAKVFVSDVGVTPVHGRPDTTAAVERVLAKAFHGEAACLVQGAGTGAIRSMLSAGPIEDGTRSIVAHTAPFYSTTSRTINDFDLKITRVDYNDDASVSGALDDQSLDWFYIQHTRQQLTDAYDPISLVRKCRERGKHVIIDDNYAVCRTPLIGVEAGASASAFSLFKLHGPEGVGIVIGDAELVDNIHRASYSGGTQVQGWQALAALHELVMVPFNWHAQAKECIKIVDALNGGAIDGVVEARAVNAQDLCVIALLDGEYANDLIQAAARNGAATYPVGSNSRYEIAPLVYRASSSTLAAQPELRGWTIRINPMRAGADVTLDILHKARSEVELCSCL